MVPIFEFGNSLRSFKIEVTGISRGNVVEEEQTMNISGLLNYRDDPRGRFLTGTKIRITNYSTHSRSAEKFEIEDKTN